MARSFKPSLNSAPFYYNTDNSSAISISQILLSVACSAGKVLKLYFSFTKQYKYNSSDSKNTQTMIETPSFTSPSHKWEMEKRKKAATTMDSKTCTFVYPVYLEITGLYCVSEGSPSIKATSCSPIQCPQQFAHCCYHSASSPGQVFVVFLSTPTVPQTSTWPSTDV